MKCSLIARSGDVVLLQSANKTELIGFESIDWMSVSSQYEADIKGNVDMLIMKTKAENYGDRRKTNCYVDRGYDDYRYS